jgi:hypothetical protein
MKKDFLPDGTKDREAGYDFTDIMSLTGQIFS